MPAVDYERALVRVRAHIASKPSHGSSQLLKEIAQIESGCQVPEGDEGYDDTPLHPRRRDALRLEEGDSQEHGAASQALA